MTGGNIFILAKKKNKSVNIKRYKAKKEFNIGMFLFAVVFIYLIVTITAYLLEDKPSIYEVREGSIVKDNTYRIDHPPGNNCKCRIRRLH